MRSAFLALALVCTAAACNEAPTVVRRFPVLTDAGSSDWEVVAAGHDHTCALKRDGRAFCWGSNRFGQLAVQHADSICLSGTAKVECSLVPVEVPIPVRFTSLTAGAYHTCGLTAARDAYCWGANDEAQLGEFTFGESTVEQIQSLLGWSQITAGDAHTCALRVDGVVYCWGDNRVGQVGNGSASGSTGPVRARVPAPVAFVSAGTERTCANATDGTMYCWGDLWVPSDSAADVRRAQPTPQAMAEAPSLPGLSVGGSGTCGFDATGFGYCWEANTHGEAGTGTRTGSDTPQRIASDVELIGISVGGEHACGIATTGVAWCWGDDSDGQLGAAPGAVAERCTVVQSPCSTTPVAVVGEQAFTMISAGLGAHTCGVTTRGNLYCWGRGSLGQLGNGSRPRIQSIPMKVVEPR